MLEETGLSACRANAMACQQFVALFRALQRIGCTFPSQDAADVSDAGADAVGVHGEHSDSGSDVDGGEVDGTGSRSPM